MEDAGRDIAEVGRVLLAPMVDEKPPVMERGAVEPVRDMVDEA